MFIIVGNYGNHTLALIQWALEAGLTEKIYVISIDTGWGEEGWLQRVREGERFAKQCGFEPVRLFAKPTFRDLIRDRKGFPSQKFQWCAGFLKGLTLLDWLDTSDPSCEATIMMGKRRLDSKANGDLAEYIEESKHHNDRKVWYPLYKHDDAQFRALINRAGFDFLCHRSLECAPCIHSGDADFNRLSIDTVTKTKALEAELGKTMFAKPIEQMVESAENMPEKFYKGYMESLYLGCGSPFGCGE